VAPDAPVPADLAARVDTVAASTGFAGVVAVHDATGPVLTAAYGVADRATGRPMTFGTRLAIASGTKGFTAVAVLRLVEAGALALDAPVRTWLGADLPEIDAAVTVEQLLAHRSGIGDYYDESETDADDFVLPVDPATLVDAEDWLPVLAGHPMVSPPDAAFAYNNGGYVLLALVAQRASGRPYHDLIGDVCAGAGMTDTGFHRHDATDLATGYLDDGRTNVALMPRYGCGDGGLSTTLADVDRFWTALGDGRIVTPATFRAMTTPHATDVESGRRYGLGVWLAPEGPDVILEGCDAGISFRSVHDPATGRTGTVMANTTDGAWPIARLLADALGTR
jgi:CubicO group peptidase (beta-lactamase class C family)